ncbi:MAG: DUF5698 domain-containing protein [Acidimicrobiia bacterium]
MYVAAVVLGIIALRLIDVSIGSLRIQYLVRGRRMIAGSLGFFESLTWLIAAGLVLSDLDQWWKAVAYASGFGLGTVLGGFLDELIASGQVFLRVLAPYGSPTVAGELRDLGFGATVINGEGRQGEVRLTILAIPRRRQNEAIRVIKALNPNAFVTVDDVFAANVHAMKANHIRK